MHKKWYAFCVGPNGGISGTEFSSPYDRREDAEAWASTKFPTTKASQIAIVELVAIAERTAAPVKIIEVKPAFEGHSKAA